MRDQLVGLGECRRGLLVLTGGEVGLAGGEGLGRALLIVGLGRRRSRTFGQEGSGRNLGERGSSEERGRDKGGEECTQCSVRVGVLAQLGFLFFLAPFC